MHSLEFESNAMSYEQSFFNLEFILNISHAIVEMPGIFMRSEEENYTIFLSSINII